MAAVQCCLTPPGSLRQPVIAAGFEVDEITDRGFGRIMRIHEPNGLVFDVHEPTGTLTAG